MPLVVQPDGTIAEGEIPPGGALVLVLFDGVVQEAYVQTGAQEIAFPSYIAASEVYTPGGDLPAAGVSLINGRVVLDTIIREVAGNV
jgi:hypothetical protein